MHVHLMSERHKIIKMSILLHKYFIPIAQNRQIKSDKRARKATHKTSVTKKQVYAILSFPRVAIAFFGTCIIYLKLHKL